MSRRSTRKRSNPAPAAAASGSSAESDDDVSASPPRRVSSRSTKCTKSMKEASDSIKDLLLMAPPARKGNEVSDGKTRCSRAGSAASDDSDDDSGDESSDEEPVGRTTRLTRSSKRQSSETRSIVSKQPKSPAVRHKTKRRVVKTDVQVTSDDESDSFSEDEESESEEEEQDELKIQRIIASRSETRSKWREICEKMNTSEIENGSRWFQNDKDSERGDDTFEERFLVKWSDVSYLHCSWELEEDMVAQIEGSKAYLTTFFRKSENGLLFGADERGDGEYFDPSFVQVERILEIVDPEPEEDEDDGRKTRRQKRSGAKDTAENKYGIILDKDHPDYESGTGRQFLVKWWNTPYSDCTYEFERDLIMNEVEYEEQVASFHERSKKPTKSEMKKAFSIYEEQTRRLYKAFGHKVRMSDEEREAKAKTFQAKLEKHVFPNGGQLRDYQAEGVAWMISNFINKRSSILADEMGLGKTIQTAVFVNYLATALSSRGPFLVVAPLSTLQHWYREFSSWTNLNTIVYHGSARDRDRIRESEFAFEVDRAHNLSFNARFLKSCHKRKAPKWERTWMVSVVITTPEMLVTDDYTELMAVNWEVLIVDEAHRLKNHSSRLASNLRDDRFNFKSTLLLTGTPIQNNMNEMWTILNIVDPRRFDDVEDFLEQYGDIKSKDKLDELHEQIRPYILRRLKEDVEKSVPPKEETLIEVELTVVQKQYYRALYERNVQFLQRNKKKALDGPSLNNLAMQLRKCCNHPFLLRGVEEEVIAQENQSGSNITDADSLVKASGKLVLLDKLLPKLKQGGHRVLIFSQFKIMLDILEDYLALRDFKAERIDGSITGKKRQMAIDRFQAKESASFIMLLSTRAGGVGINLTAADTCIIFDSDWNPQNDLQAQARCHRIGQTKSVKVYRLLSRKSYEMQMFHTSSLKMGLDQAVLQGIEGDSCNSEGTLTKEEVEKLLRHGAYDIFNEEKAGSSEKESNDFISQDIDSILARRTKTVVHENTGSKSNAAGGTFSKATFKASASSSEGAVDGVAEDVDIDDPNFWTKMVGEARVDESDNLAGKKRKRNKANYSEKDYERRLLQELQARGQYSSSSEEENDAASGDEKGSNASVSSVEDNEFDLRGDQELENETLHKLQEQRKKLRQNRERNRWGGKGPKDWQKLDVEAVLKVLQTYGYGNIPWDQMQKEMKFLRPGGYDCGEVKRMCWALVLTALREAVDDDVRGTVRRAERAAEKKRGAEEEKLLQHSPSDGGVLGIAGAKSAIDDDPQEQVARSFEKVWQANSSWATKAIEDAMEYAKGSQPRSRAVIDEAMTGKKDTKANNSPLTTAFNENVWPSLRSRGWKKESTVDGKKHYTYGGETYRSVSAVLDAAPKVHKELQNTVASIISSVADSETTVEPTSHSEGTTLIDPKSMSAERLTDLLNSYSPLQLLCSRTKSNNSKITLHARKLLGTLSFLHTAHALVEKADSVPAKSEQEKNLQLEKLLSVDKKAALPHPSWTKMHDATLIRAIAKHGWIERERSCHAIANDEAIKWGHPFDSEHAAASPEKSDQVIVPSESIPPDLRAVAERAAAIFNTDGVILGDLKGFNKELVVKSYGLVQRINIENKGTGIPSPVWYVDEARLKLATESGEQGCSAGKVHSGSEQDLPSRKDLLKRVKVLLSRSSAVSSSAEPPSGAMPDSAKPTHSFCVLDQSNRCNILLAELLRGVMKISTTKGNGLKVCKKLLQYASKEVEQQKGAGPSASSDKDDMAKIREHLRLVTRSIKRSHRQAKNVIRAILGVEPLQPKSPNDTIFPVLPSTSSFSKGENSVADQQKETKRAQQKQKESAAGDVAINRALAAGLKQGKRLQVKNDDDTASYLKLTSIETLLLSVICSQGLPVWTEDWEVLVDPQCSVEHAARPGEEFAINWHRMGGVVLNAATVWQEIASKNLQQKLNHLDRNRMNLSEIQVQEINNECRQLQSDLDRKLQAIADARQLRADPHQLARKSIMMLEALGRLMGAVDTSRGAGVLKKIKATNRTENGLGPRVLQWCSKELTRWAHSLNIVDDTGRCISSTASDYIEDLPDINLAAFFDRKACRTIFIQVAQQTRLRSIFIKNGVDKMRQLLPKALKNSQNNGDVWDGCPRWWCSGGDGSDTLCQDDTDLLCGILDFGYSGFDEMVKQNSSFCQRIEEEKNTKDGHDATMQLGDADLKPRPSLTRASVQQRVNNLTRELSSLEDTADVMRLVSERANKTTALGDKPASPDDDASGTKRLASGGVQTGIDAFFSSSQMKKKISTGIPFSKVSDESDSSIEVIEVDSFGSESGMAEKRKPEMSGAIDLSPSKKQKSL